MSNFVLVVDQNRVPLNPLHPGETRRLLNAGKAAVLRRFPFVLILKEEVEESTPTPVTLKIDPGSKTTGIVLMQGDAVVWAAELTHRGRNIEAALTRRSQLRRGRRTRKTRYRKPRFLNRRKPKGWLAPSLRHRVQTTETWVRRLCRFAPVAEVVQELIRFDTQAMQNLEIAGAEYQQGTLYGYEIREYLLEKWERQCAYCGKQDTPLWTNQLNTEH